jgi:chromosome segregation ATPase
MIILNSKKIKELQAENEELKALIQNLTEKEAYLKQFDEVLRKARIEYAELTKKKDQTALTLELLEKDRSQLNNQIQKLSNEIEQLREMKVEEQNQVLTLKSVLTESGKNLEGNNVNKLSELKLPVFKEIEVAERRKKEIERQTIELEKRFREVYQRVLEVSDMEQTLDAEIKKKKDEINNLNERKNEFSKDQLKNFNTRIAALKDEEKKNLQEIKQRIKQLSDREAELLSKIDNRAKELQEIEEKIEHKNLYIEKEAEDKLLSLIVEEQQLNDSLDQKKQSLTEIEQSILSLREERTKITDELINKESFLKTEAILLSDKINDAELNSEENQSLEKEANTIQGVIKSLKEEENRIRESIEQLSQTEVLKKEFVLELNDNLSAKEIQFASLEQDYETKSGRLKEISVKNKRLLEELAFKTNELSIVENSLKSKTTRLYELTSELSVFEDKLNYLNSEAAKRESIKAEFEEKIKNEKDSHKKLEEHYNKLREIIPLLEKRKEEFELNNGMFEKRFADMFKHYSTQMGEMYKKKNLLEQMLIKKEKDVNEKDEMLLEKLSALDETEKVLSIRQTEAESFEDLIKTINEQHELLAGDIATLDDKNLEKRIQNKELHIESDLFQKKLIEFENGLKDLFRRSEERFNRNADKRSKLDNEIREYEFRLNELNKGIRDSMNELVELRTLISRIKVEHEEHRLGINKLAAIKKKLEEEIGKHQVVIDKYTKIKEKIRQEQEHIRRKRELIESRELITQQDENTKMIGPDQSRWIKI